MVKRETENCAEDNVHMEPTTCQTSSRARGQRGQDCCLLPLGMLLASQGPHNPWPDGVRFIMADSSFKLLGCPGIFGVQSFIWVEITVLPSHFHPLQAAGQWFTARGQWIPGVMWAISKCN